jgi:hypothetical protein
MRHGYGIEYNTPRVGVLGPPKLVLPVGVGLPSMFGAALHVARLALVVCCWSHCPLRIQRSLGWFEVLMRPWSAFVSLADEDRGTSAVCCK